MVSVLLDIPVNESIEFQKNFLICGFFFMLRYLVTHPQRKGNVQCFFTLEFSA